jgi:hypothetical protein
MAVCVVAYGVLKQGQQPKPRGGDHFNEVYAASTSASPVRPTCRSASIHLASSVSTISSSQAVMLERRRSSGSSFTSLQWRPLLLTIVFLLDVISWHICEVTNINGHLVYNQTWFNVLADRFILEKLLDRLRDRQYVDFQEITKEGTKAAAADVELFLKEKTVWAEWGGLKKTLAGIGYFLWFWISYGIFYGIAAFLGSFLRGGF